MKAYSHTNEKLLYNNTETIQGVGVSYQESFDTLRELLRKYFGFYERESKRDRCSVCFHRYDKFRFENDFIKNGKLF